MVCLFSFTIILQIRTRGGEGSYDHLNEDHPQGRSCKQICWPPGFDGLQRVGLDPGQYDHHPHGVVHVGKEQDV